MEEYFLYTWDKDNNYAIHTDEDVLLFNQMPQKVQQNLYRVYLFSDFCTHFRKFYTFKKTHDNIMNSFWTWEDEVYSEFMIKMFRSLNPIYFKPKEQIHRELEEVHEILFLEDGFVDFGFEINNRSKYCVRKKRCILGIFESTYERRAYMITRAYNFCEGFYIRKNHWRNLMMENE